MFEASSELARYDCAVLTVRPDAVVVRRHEGDDGAERRRVEPWRINGSSMFDDGQKISPSVITYKTVTHVLRSHRNM